MTLKMRISPEEPGLKELFWSRSENFDRYTPGHKTQSMRAGLPTLARGLAGYWKRGSNLYWGSPEP